jgi:hypothetical protein
MAIGTVTFRFQGQNTQDPKIHFWVFLRALEKYLGKHFIPFTFTSKAKVHWLGIKVELSSFLEAKSPTEMFTATLTYFSDPGLQDPRRASLALSSRKLVLHTEKSEK